MMVVGRTMVVMMILLEWRATLAAGYLTAPSPRQGRPGSIPGIIIIIIAVGRIAVVMMPLLEWRDNRRTEKGPV